jgi:2-polyprenyl-3-methyl-5-hydroxy-6-metoxy-1,4-benzoquinol methylase
MPNSVTVSGVSCRVCGEVAGSDQTFAGLRECRGCGFIFSPDVDAAELEQLYDERYFKGVEYPDYLGQQHALRRSMRRHLEQMARIQAPRGALLEVGCAYGLFLDEARRSFDSVTGIDIAAEPIAHARDVLKIDARRGDFLTDDFGGRRFDVICMWDTIEHLPKPDEFLARGAALLRPNGLLFLTTGDIGSWNARWRGAAWRQIHPPSHVNYFSRQTIATLLHRTGYDVIRIERARYYHTVYNVLASIQLLRGGKGDRLAGAILSLMGEARARRVGLWIDLGDIMFVGARRRAPSIAIPA